MSSPPTVARGNQFYADKAIIVSTNVGSLDIFWLQDSEFPIITASTIQAGMNALQAQIAANKAEIEFNWLPIGSLIPWYANAGDPPPGWIKCDGSDPVHCPDLNGTFLMGAHLGGAKAAGGNANVTLPFAGSNRHHGDGNGWSLSDDHFAPDDMPSIPILPPYKTVLYIMKISNTPLPTMHAANEPPLSEATSFMVGGMAKFASSDPKERATAAATRR